MHRLAERARHRLQTDDAGTSLIELVVGMAIMTVFMAIFTTAVLSMTATANKVEAVTISSGQVNQAFLILDKQVRYAAAITNAGTSSTGNWYVEFDKTYSGTEQCTQLRIDNTSKQLQERSWTVSGASITTPSNWVMLANNITNGTALSGSADQPFTVPAAVAGASSTYQQLTITLSAGSGTVTTSNTRSSASFTALNSNAAATTNNSKCQQAGRP